MALWPRAIRSTSSLCGRARSGRPQPSESSIPMTGERGPESFVPCLSYPPKHVARFLTFQLASWHLFKRVEFCQETYVEGLWCEAHPHPMLTQVPATWHHPRSSASALPEQRHPMPGNRLLVDKGEMKKEGWEGVSITRSNETADCILSFTISLPTPTAFRHSSTWHKQGLWTGFTFSCVACPAYSPA